jgi:hypothetical protein
MSAVYITVLKTIFILSHVYTSSPTTTWVLSQMFHCMLCFVSLSHTHTHAHTYTHAHAQANKNKLRGQSQWTNFTERATTACRRSNAKFCSLRVPRGQRDGPHDRNLGFLDRMRYFFFQVPPQLYSRDWVEPVPAPTSYQKNWDSHSDLRICSQ